MIWKKSNLPQPKIKFKPQIILAIISLILTVGMPISISHKIPAQARTEKSYEAKLFETALSFTLYFEGGFSNHPADKGGRTYKGILQSVYNAYRRRRGLPPLDVTQMSDAELMEIYQGYWDNSRSATMHPALAVVMFDTAVNFGINNSVTFLQQALGLPQTGIFDTKTKEALAEGNNRNTALQMINER
ncbi:hypothetical protein AFK68_07350, partial [Hydrocoleum sp. CS-953]|uniref:glycoside hydrolase family 108 protein n=1 Tax=Hydrocoleum sp. CS-953 TaxID=1671698 RepID=UPI000B9A407B